MAAPACECSVKLACTPASEGKSGTATYTLGAVTTLATTIVAWGGLSSLQDLVRGGKATKGTPVPAQSATSHLQPGPPSAGSA